MFFIVSFTLAGLKQKMGVRKLIKSAITSLLGQRGSLYNALDAWQENSGVRQPVQATPRSALKRSDSLTTRIITLNLSFITKPFLLTH